MANQRLKSLQIMNNDHGWTSWGHCCHSSFHSFGREMIQVNLEGSIPDDSINIQWTPKGSSLSAKKHSEHFEWCRPCIGRRSWTLDDAVTQFTEQFTEQLWIWLNPVQWSRALETSAEGRSDGQQVEWAVVMTPSGVYVRSSQWEALRQC